MMLREATNAWLAGPSIFDVAFFAVSTVLSLVGFGIAIVQIFKTKNAVEAARIARIQVGDKIVASQLTGLLRDIELSAIELEEDSRTKNVLALSRTLAKYAQACNVSAHLVGKLPTVDVEFVAILTDSATKASEAKEALVRETLTVSQAIDSVFPGVTQVKSKLPNASKTLELQLESDTNAATKETR